MPVWLTWLLETIGWAAFKALFSRFSVKKEPPNVAREEAKEFAEPDPSAGDIINRL